MSHNKCNGNNPHIEHEGGFHHIREYQGTSKCRQNTDDPAERRQCYHFHRKLHEDFSFQSADSKQNTDLAGPVGDRYDMMFMMPILSLTFGLSVRRSE